MHGSSSSATPRGTPSQRGKSPRFRSESSPQAAAGSSSANNPDRPGGVFISSMDIAVEGAIPIETETYKETNVPVTTLTTPTESKRAPRKSKTDAMVALNNQARSSSVEPDDMDTSEDISQRYKNSAPIPVSPKLDLSTVKTSTPRRPKEEGFQDTRLFGLEDCPSFHPTQEEFKDPMAYIKSISQEATQYGICKIVPPEGWQMPFVTDTESFRFKTRLQRLNSIEASSRARLSFLELLYRFHNQEGNARVVVPTINHKPVDLWLLRKEVQRLGGYDAVTKNKQWADLGNMLGYRGIPGIATQIKNAYARVILPYEQFCEKARNSPTMASPAKPRDAHLKTHTDIQNNGKSRMNSAAGPSRASSRPVSPTSQTSSPLSEPPDEIDHRDSGRRSSSKLRRSTRMGSQEQSPRKSATSIIIPSPLAAPVFHDKENADMKIGTPEVRITNTQASDKPSPTHLEQQYCEICQKNNDGEKMLLCDGCDLGFHMFCLDPPLETIPKEQWYCFSCLAGTGGDFGFDEGEEHSLSSFQARDKEFRRLWFESHQPEDGNVPPSEGDIKRNRIGNVTVSEYDVEKEFWRLVESPDETVEIEYGADVHSTTHGSAMPTMETHPLNPYSKDPWNLNNIPILPDSLLRFIKSDISGMTVPWTYVGMAFSTFCWHNEDHYTYSINFMHWGEAKTWYGIPGDDADKFEAAIRLEAPELFDAQPDLLFQLVTLMNPKRVKQAGVRVFACNQRAGEFVVTFPKAYHAGFNHGLNFNEAVNFALPDWLPLGRDCVQRYAEHRKLPVFSHDELLITITQQSQSIKTAIWLIDSLKEMTDREMKAREKAREIGLTEVVEEEDRALEEQYQCAVCKVFCYLSQVICPCTGRVVCIEHVKLLCDSKGPHRITLRQRFTDEDLLETYNQVSQRAMVPTAWQNKLSKLLSEVARPPLRSLRALVSEGDRIAYPLPELANLRKCVNKANDWVDNANTFIIRKQSRKRSRRKGRPSIAEKLNPDDFGDREDRSLDDLYALLREVEILGFDSPEITTLRNVAESAEDTKAKAASLLSTKPSEEEREQFLVDCKRLLIQGSSLNVYLDELSEVEKIVDREQLINDMEEKLDDNDASITLEEVRQFLTRARLCSLPSDNKFIKMLDARQREGNDWESRARSVLHQPIKTIEELNEFADMDPSIPMDPAVLSQLMTARTKALDFEKQAKAWLACEPNGLKARLTEVSRMTLRASKDFSIHSVDVLKRSADIAADLEARCESVLRNRYPTGDEDVFHAIGKWKDYAREHLSMFVLPTFERLEVELKKHETWIREIPWYCDDHQETHSQQVLEDVLENTRHDDDLPPSDEFYTCICNKPVRPPPSGVQSDAVQCDHCSARFHGECAKTGGSCPFCDHHHWNGAIHKQRSFHFCYLPTILAKAPEISKHYSEDYKQLEIIVHRVDRLSAVIGQFLSYTSANENQRPGYIPQVRHYMRKLYKIQFAVSPSPDISFGLDLAGLHRILAGRPPLLKPKKRKRPKFTFGQDQDLDAKDHTRCICRARTAYVLGGPTVECEACKRIYHMACVFFTVEKQGPGLDKSKFMCPICCLRKGKPYAFSEVRVIPTDSISPDPSAYDLYVNTKGMLDNFSSTLLVTKLPPPQRHTLFVELIQFEPGSGVEPSPNRNSNSAGSAPAHRSHMVHTGHGNPMQPSMHYPNGRQAFPPQAHHAQALPPIQHATSGMGVFSATAPATATVSGVPPAPPWSRWGTVSTPMDPPTQSRRNPNEGEVDVVRRTDIDVGRRDNDGGRLTSQSPVVPASRKRKQEEMSQTPISQHPLRVDDDMRGPGVSVKRHAGPNLTPTMSPRPIQTLSPSLAMIVSPTNQEVHASPRAHQLPPLRTAPGASPLLPPVKTLMGNGDARPL